MSVDNAYLWRPWMDHSVNGFSGWTVTVPASSGPLILTAITVLITLAGEAAWVITAYALHQYRAAHDPQTGLFRVQQVSLRNSGGAMGSALEMIQTGHAWSGNISRAKTRAYGLAGWPLSIKIVFLVASIFVGRITIPSNKANVVRLEAHNCGLESFNSSGETDVLYQIQAKHANDIRQSRAYAYNCYDAAEGALGCTSLKMQKLPFTSKPDTACPFGSLCTLGPNTAFMLESDVLDSLTHFGINSPAEDRVTVQIAETCSIISTKAYVKQVPDLRSNGDWFLTEIYLGPVNQFVANYSWFYADLQSKQQVPYTTFALVSYANVSTTEQPWLPIEQLAFPNADTSVLFTAPNSIMYKATSQDPMYYANGTYTYTGDDNVTWILPNYWLSTMVCADQLNICNPTTNACTGFQGTRGTTTYLNSTLQLNEIQKATAERLILAHLHSHMYDVVNGQGGAALAANNVLYQLLSDGLPSDQWQIEATKWFQTALANMQHRIVEFPNNAWAQNGDVGVVPAKDFSINGRHTDAMERLCNRQLIRSTDMYQSFSMSGIVIVVVVSVALIITSWTLDCCVRRRRDRRAPGSPKYYKRLAWLADGKEQLLRMALKSAGYRDGWDGELDTIPSRLPTEGGVERDILPPGIEDHALVVAEKADWE